MSSNDFAGTHAGLDGDLDADLDADSATLDRLVCRLTGAQTARRVQLIQSLWSGYGEIVRFEVEGLGVPSVVVKHVQPPSAAEHPRGWSGALSHQRKLRSYGVERTWYEHFASKTPPQSRVPRLLGRRTSDEQSVFVLEDLNAAGFPERRSNLTDFELRACLQWLAYFHAFFLGTDPFVAPHESLWEIGTYWNLATRPDELRAMPDSELRDAAKSLDARLSGAKYQTLVHGDAKVANFCFAAPNEVAGLRRQPAEPCRSVAAVDFQYVGAGCGMKDVAYLLSSCLSSSQCETGADSYLDYYFEQLTRALKLYSPGVKPTELQAEWRELYCFAWADFQRFLVGWAPGHYKLHGYCQAQTQQALAAL